MTPLPQFGADPPRRIAAGHTPGRAPVASVPTSPAGDAGDPYRFTWTGKQVLEGRAHYCDARGPVEAATICAALNACVVGDRVVAP